jgi:hypothetical protein
MPKKVHSSTRNAFTSLGPHGSSILSLRCNGVSRRQDVTCRVFVPFVDYSTFRTYPLPDRERQRLNDVPAVKTPLAGREEPVNLDQFFSIPLALVLQHSDERSETGIGDRAGKAVVLDHAAHVQILSDDGIETAHKAGSGFLEIVVSRIGNKLLQLSHRDSRSLPASTAFLAARQDYLQPSQFLEFGLQVLRVRNTLTSGQGGEAVNAQVDTDRGTCFGKMLNNFIPQLKQWVSCDKIYEQL